MASFFSLALVLLLFLQRPAALGQNFAAYGLMLIIFVTAWYIAWRRFRIPGYTTQGLDLFAVALIAFFYLLYEFVVAAAFGMSNLEDLFKESVIAVIVVVCYGIFLAEPENNRRFFRQFTTVVSILGWSSAITLCWALIGNLDSIALVNFSMKGYEAAEDVQAGTIYFPISMVYMGINAFDLPLLRFSGFFREPGIYQAVAAYCFVLATLGRRSWAIRIGLMLGIVCAFSTIGVAMLIAAIGISYFLRNKITVVRLTVTACILAGGAIAAVYMPVVGLSEKSETAGESISDRTVAMENGLRLAAENPIGYGLFGRRDANQDINLIAAIGSIGVLGFLLQIVLLSGFRGSFTRSTFLRMGACAPLLLTAVFSQPIAGAGMMYALIMVWPETVS